MIRNLKVLGLALAAVFAMSAVAASAASAAPAKFTAGVGAGETATIKGGQIGTDTFHIGIRTYTCATATVEGKALTVGPESTEVTLTPTYGTCHAVIFGITRTATVTTNGCAYRFNATKNTGGYPFSADLHIECPPEKQIEIHVYETSNANDAGAKTLCTYDIKPQTVLDAIELTNVGGNVVADINEAEVELHNTILSVLCNSSTNPISVYTGEDKLEAFKEGGAKVESSVS
jgi:hypothetical protein